MRHLLLFVLSFAVMTPALGWQGIDPEPDLSLVWDQVRRAPDDVGVACVPLTDPTRAVYHNVNRPFPLASISKVLIFIEYARQLDRQQISWGEMVQVDVLNTYNLGRTDRGAHEDFLASFDEPPREISLWDVATTGMLQYSSNAASDYLLNRLRPVDWDALYADLNLTNTTPPHMLTLIALSMNNHRTGPLSLSAANSPTLIADTAELFTAYRRDDAWRAAEIAYRDAVRDFPAWSVQSAVLNQTASGTVRDFTLVMAAVYGDGGPLSPTVKGTIRDALRWRSDADIDAVYIEYGSKLGFYSGGTLNLVAYGQPINGEPVISVVFFRDLPRRPYFDMRNDDKLGELAHWMNLNACVGLIDNLGARVPGT